MRIIFLRKNSTHCLFCISTRTPYRDLSQTKRPQLKLGAFLQSYERVFLRSGARCGLCFGVCAASATEWKAGVPGDAWLHVWSLCGSCDVIPYNYSISRSLRKSRVLGIAVYGLSEMPNPIAYFRKFRIILYLRHLYFICATYAGGISIKK